MKKTLVTLLTLSLVLVSLTACNSSTPIDESKTENSSAESTTILSTESTTSSVESTVIESTTNTSELTPIEKVVGIYGETEIPDIPCGDVDDEGKASPRLDSEALASSLDSMIFETHNFGEYTVRLVGDKVRTDEVNFPDSIYTQNLHAEVEKNGIIIDDNVQYSDWFYCIAQFPQEFRLFTDRIGSYLDWYELEYPVLVKRMYYDNDPDRIVPKAADFLIIQNDKIEYGLLGTFDKGIGIDPINIGDPYHPQLHLHKEDGSISRLSSFSADRFRIADSKTLIDDEAGVKYTFDFEECFKHNSPKAGHLYTAEWIN